MLTRRGVVRRTGLVLAGTVLAALVLPLMAEAEAYCAEATFAIAGGGQARLEYARVQDELREATWFRRFSNDALAVALASRCPQLAATAAREEAEWRAARARRRAD